MAWHDPHGTQTQPLRGLKKTLKVLQPVSKELVNRPYLIASIPIKMAIDQGCSIGPSDPGEKLSHQIPPHPPHPPLPRGLPWSCDKRPRARCHCAALLQALMAELKLIRSWGWGVSLGQIITLTWMDYFHALSKSDLLNFRHQKSEANISCCPDLEMVILPIPHIFNAFIA